MKIIKPSVEEFIPQNPIQHIERCGRVCYKSEDKITDTSAEKFVSGIVKRGHLSVTEHFRYVISVSQWAYYQLTHLQPNYLAMSQDTKFLVSGSSRAFTVLYQKCMEIRDYDSATIVAECIKCIINNSKCSAVLFDGVALPEVRFVPNLVEIDELTDRERLIHGWHTLKFTCDRGVTHELVRHRPCSFSQESTRYCNYSGDKFGNELTFIQPCFWKGDYYKRMGWSAAMQEAEKRYMSLLVSGATPQEARSVLPNSLKTELVITATNEEWLHLLKLRCSKAAHPQCREVCEMAREILKKDDPEIFGGL